MSKTYELKKELQRLFKTITANVYYEGTQNPTTYPRLIYELSELTYDSGKITLQLEVNILDRDSSTKTVDELADNLQTALNKYYFINTEIQFSTYKGLRQSIKEEDKQIKRLRLLFEIQLHELKGE